jgi:hypothetical protein
MLSLFTPLSANFTQHSRQSSKAAYQPTEIILHTLDSIMSRLRRLPLPLQTLRNIFATALLFTSQLTPPYTPLTLKNYPPYRKCSAGFTLWYRPVNLADSAVLFGKEFFFVEATFRQLYTSWQYFRPLPMATFQLNWKWFKRRCFMV